MTERILHLSLSLSSYNRNHRASLSLSLSLFFRFLRLGFLLGVCVSVYVEPDCAPSPSFSLFCAALFFIPSSCRARARIFRDAHTHIFPSFRNFSFSLLFPSVCVLARNSYIFHPGLMENCVFFFARLKKLGEFYVVGITHEKIKVAANLEDYERSFLK